MDWMKYRRIYFLVSGIVIAVGIASLLSFGLPMGIDFRGGAIGEYKISKDFSETDLRDKLKEKGLELQSISKSTGGVYIFRFPPIESQKKNDILEALKSFDENVTEQRFETVGASFGPELIQKTLYALLISAGLILIWVAIQFKSFKFGAAATIATLHDSLVLVGTYSLLGRYFGAEVDFLFVTAVLTVLSFSVHDTIVVYDRIRETQKKEGGTVYEIANRAISETMVRSLNNSFTIIFMLFALILLGGATTRWFAVALFIGAITGTYSSPFVAVPILVTWDELSKGQKRPSLSQLNLKVKKLPKFGYRK